MVRMFTWMAPAVAALGLVFAVSASKVQAADAAPAAGGTVAGTVVDKDGKPVADAKVRVMKPMQRGGPGGPGAGQKGAAPKAADAPAEQPKRQPPAAVAEGTTDKDGKFSIANVPAGDYMVVVVQQGAGFAREKVSVKDGETATVALKLEERKPGGAGGPGGRGGKKPAAK